MNYVTFIGLITATLTTIAFLPQFIKTLRTKSTKDISLGMYVIFCLGIILWLIYGILRNDIAVIVAQILVFSQAFIILILKFKYG
jgi:MtN3 and saliva related transmembrane protein